MTLTETCPDCKVVLPKFDGPVHRYLGASASCWAMYAALGGGEPPIAPGPLNALLVDAYTTQHPGAVQSESGHSIGGGASADVVRHYRARRARSSARSGCARARCAKVRDTNTRALRG